MLPPALITLLEPWQFMGLALSFLPATILSLLRDFDLGTLLSWPRLQAAWFGRFWAHVGPMVRLNADKNVVPLVQGRVTHGVVPSTAANDDSNPPPLPPVSGTVLEIGPGSGMWTSRT